MPTNAPRPTKAQRRDEAREKALALRKQQEARARRNRLLAILGLVVAVVALVGVAFAIINQSRQNEAAYGSSVYGGDDANVVAPTLSDVQAPAGTVDDGGLPVSDEGIGVAGDGDVELSVYFDLQCPYCQQFDAANAETLDSLVAGGGVTVDYHLISFLDGASRGTYYSSRAANALATVMDQAPEQFTAFMTRLYTEQPPENTSGLTDAEIADIARDAGVPADVIDTFTDTVEGTYQVAGSDGTTTEKDGTWRTFSPWIVATTDAAKTFMGGQLGTPAIYINGEKYTGSPYDPAALTAAVDAARG